MDAQGIYIAVLCVISIFRLEHVQVNAISVLQISKDEIQQLLANEKYSGKSGYNNYNPANRLPAAISANRLRNSGSPPPAPPPPAIPAVEPLTNTNVELVPPMTTATEPPLAAPMMPWLQMLFNGLYGGRNYNHPNRFGPLGHLFSGEEEPSIFGMRSKRGLTSALLNSFNSPTDLKNALAVDPTEVIAHQLGPIKRQVKTTTMETTMTTVAARNLPVPAEPSFDQMRASGVGRPSHRFIRGVQPGVVDRTVGSRAGKSFVAAQHAGKISEALPPGCAKETVGGPVFG